MNDVEVVRGQSRALTAAEFYKLAAVPPEIEWFANLRNPNTRKAYENDLREFRGFVGIERPEEFRTVTRAHVIAWRKELERRACAPTTIQRKLAALSSLFAYLAGGVTVWYLYGRIVPPDRLVCTGIERWLRSQCPVLTVRAPLS